jgi:hypothetical protein
MSRSAHRQESPFDGWVLVAGMVLIGVAAMLLGVVLFLLLTPEIEPRGLTPVRHPQPTATSSEAPVHPPVNKVELIIQQNVDCWYPVPGATCGPERTYL